LKSIDFERFLGNPEIPDYTPAYRQALNLIWYRAGRDYEDDYTD